MEDYTCRVSEQIAQTTASTVLPFLPFLEWMNTAYEV